MSKEQIIAEIKKLSEKERSEVFDELSEDWEYVHRKKQALSVFEKLKGRGKNILNLDPQEYIRTIRNDNRI